jgi:6-phosphogluconate dehydrogenase
VVVHDHDPPAVEALVGEGAAGASDLDALVRSLDAPRAVWVMLPAGEVTETTVNRLAASLFPGDVIIDGGNSFWKDDIRRAGALQERGLYYLDVGTSGGVWGLERGYCMMIGGEAEVVRRLEPIFATLAPGLGDAPRTRADVGGTRAPSRATFTRARAAPATSPR